MNNDEAFTATALVEARRRGFIRLLDQTKQRDLKNLWFLECRQRQRPFVAVIGQGVTVDISFDVWARTQDLSEAEERHVTDLLVGLPRCWSFNPNVFRVQHVDATVAGAVASELARIGGES